MFNWPEKNHEQSWNLKRVIFVWSVHEKIELLGNQMFVKCVAFLYTKRRKTTRELAFLWNLKAWEKTNPQEHFCYIWKKTQKNYISVASSDEFRYIFPISLFVFHELKRSIQDSLLQFLWPRIKGNLAFSHKHEIEIEAFQFFAHFSLAALLVKHQ